MRLKFKSNKALRKNQNKKVFNSKKWVKIVAEGKFHPFIPILRRDKGELSWIKLLTHLRRRARVPA